MKPIGIDLSSKQVSKLKKGGKVRVKKGEGFCLLVHPDKYNLMNRTFGKNKGIQISLTPEEIKANQNFSENKEVLSTPEEIKANQAPELEGKGIFGKKFDRFLEKHGVKDAAYRIGDMIKPTVKGAITAGLTSGAAALGAAQPELIPFLPAGVGGLSYLAHDYLDNPGKYQQSGLKSRGAKNLAGQVVKAKANEELNRHLGTNYDYMGRAGLENLHQEMGNQGLSTMQGALRRRIPPVEEYNDRWGEPMSRGSGIHSHVIHERGSIGRGSSMVQSRYIVPPALQSQPHGANFQMKHFLPPQYYAYFDPMLDHEHNGTLGMGLYAGGGLYT